MRTSRSGRRETTSSISLTVPAGVSETLVVISVNGGAEVATLETKTATATVPAGTLTPTTICSCTYTAFAIGADYPLVEAGPPTNTSMRPTLAGANGTSDLTVSAALVGFAQ